jgi:hypothetical protein
MRRLRKIRSRFRVLDPVQVANTCDRLPMTRRRDAARLVLEYTLGKPTTPIDVSTGCAEVFKAIDREAFDDV